MLCSLAMANMSQWASDDEAEEAMREAEAAASPAAPRVSIPVGPPAVLPVQNSWPAAIA